MWVISVILKILILLVFTLRVLLKPVDQSAVYLWVQPLNVRPQILEVGSEWMDVEEGRDNAYREEERSSDDRCWRNRWAPLEMFSSRIEALSFYQRTLSSREQNMVLFAVWRKEAAIKMDLMNKCWCRWSRVQRPLVETFLLRHKHAVHHWILYMVPSSQDFLMCFLDTRDLSGRRWDDGTTENHDGNLILAAVILFVTGESTSREELSHIFWKLC